MVCEKVPERCLANLKHSLSIFRKNTSLIYKCCCVTFSFMITNSRSRTKRNKERQRSPRKGDERCEGNLILVAYVQPSLLQFAVEWLI